jgi:hypothetical protein
VPLQTPFSLHFQVTVREKTEKPTGSAQRILRESNEWKGDPSNANQRLDERRPAGMEQLNTFIDKLCKDLTFSYL